MTRPLPRIVRRRPSPSLASSWVAWAFGDFSRVAVRFASSPSTSARMTSATESLAQRCSATTEPTAPHPIRRTLGGSEGMLSNLGSNRGDRGPLALRGRGHKPDAGVQNPWYEIACGSKALTLFKVEFDPNHGFVPPASRIVLNRVGSDVGGEQTCPWHTNATGPVFASFVLIMGSTGGGTYASSRSTTSTVFPAEYVPLAVSCNFRTRGSLRGPSTTTSAGGWIHNSAARWEVPAKTGPYRL